MHHQHAADTVPEYHPFWQILSGRADASSGNANLSFVLAELHPNFFRLFLQLVNSNPTFQCACSFCQRGAIRRFTKCVLYSASQDVEENIEYQTQDTSLMNLSSFIISHWWLLSMYFFFWKVWHSLYGDFISSMYLQFTCKNAHKWQSRYMAAT